MSQKTDFFKNLKPYFDFDKTNDALKEVKELNYKIASIEQAENSVSLNDFQFSHNDKLAIIITKLTDGISFMISVNNSWIIAII